VERPIVIAAGGTGGHFFPAEALAGELLRRGRRIVLMTDARVASAVRSANGGGLAGGVFEEQETVVLRGAGIAGRGLWRGAAAVLALALGTRAARSWLRARPAAAVIGFGGYPAVAPGLAARLTRPRPRLLLHEQNAVLGRANRLLAPLADVLALSHAGTARVPGGVRTVLTGNPVRPALAALAGQGYAAPAPDRPFRLLVLGGSLGARVFADVVPAALAALPAALRARLQVSQQCRAEDLERVRAAYGGSGIAVELAPFFADVADLLAAAHLVVARAGASTVAELAVAGRPSVLVPLPGAIDDHQTANAGALARAGGAFVLPQPAFTPEALAGRIAVLAAAPAALQAAAQAAAGCGAADAARRLADLVEQTIAQDFVA
jgi:UDP-N-acetylglucosamine--N-acetylmuramyl-(pentapeptide) pyrophosphoryl-undecaprenol N-acetylglucosamine transferase